MEGQGKAWHQIWSPSQTSKRGVLPTVQNWGHTTLYLTFFRVQGNELFSHRRSSGSSLFGVWPSTIFHCWTKRSACTTELVGEVNPGQHRTSRRSMSHFYTWSQCCALFQSLKKVITFWWTLLKVLAIHFAQEKSVCSPYKSSTTTEKARQSQLWLGCKQHCSSVWQKWKKKSRNPENIWKETKTKENGQKKIYCCCLLHGTRTIEKLVWMTWCTTTGIEIHAIHSRNEKNWTHEHMWVAT